VDLLDYIGAHICQSIAMSFGTKHIPLEKFLLLKRESKDRTRQQMDSLRVALGG
jgi:hypothetical protein